jgi:hypothetical protein
MMIRILNISHGHLSYRANRSMNQRSIQGDETAMRKCKTAAVRRWSTGRGIVADRSNPSSVPVDRSLIASTGRPGPERIVDRSRHSRRPVDLRTEPKRSRHRPVEEHADRSPISRASVDQSSTPPSTGRPREKNVSSPSDVTKFSYASEASMAHRSYCKACSLGNLGLRPSYAKDSKVLPPFLQIIQRGYL